MKGANAAAQEAALKQALKTYADYMAAVTRELRKINELSAVIQDDDAVKSVMTQIERIRSAMPGNKIEDVYVTTGHIVFKTGVIHAHNSRTNRRHNLGRILMMVPIESLIGQMANPIVFQPLDFVLKGSANNTAYMIPHVSGNGGFCYGNATDPMIQAVAQRDLITLVDIAIRFVENPNMGDGMGEVLKYWPEVE
jgi:hypothetical protein